MKFKSSVVYSIVFVVNYFLSFIFFELQTMVMISDYKSLKNFLWTLFPSTTNAPFIFTIDIFLGLCGLIKASLWLFANFCKLNYSVYNKKKSTTLVVVLLPWTFLIFRITTSWRNIFKTDFIPWWDTDCLYLYTPLFAANTAHKVKWFTIISF